MHRAADKEKCGGRQSDSAKKFYAGRFFRVLYALALLLGGILFAGQGKCYGQESLPENVFYTNQDTGYRVLVEDGAELLTEEERLELAREMQGITAYGSAAFVTVENNDFSTEGFARDYYMDRFGTDSGTVFVIDMDNRNIWIHSDGAVYRVVTTAYANTVADNVYRYASRGDYYEWIAQPMKYISNALLAMILALLANFGLVICFTRLRKPGGNAVLANIHRRFTYSEIRAVHTHQSEIYDPVSSGSDGGSSGGSGGGGSSGGGSSGGGGGHSF